MTKKKKPKTRRTENQEKEERKKHMNCDCVLEKRGKDETAADSFGVVAGGLRYQVNSP